MSLIKGVQSFTQELADRKIVFGIIGGLAVFAYGGERTTFDVDFLIHADHKNDVKEIVRKVNLRIANENFEVIQLSGEAQLAIIFANRTMAQAMLGRLRTVGNFSYPVVSPEDLIGLKIQGFAGNRTREYTDKADILTTFRNVSNLDFTIIRQYADIFSVWNEIQELKGRL